MIWIAVTIAAVNVVLLGIAMVSNAYATKAAKAKDYVAYIHYDNQCTRFGGYAAQCVVATFFAVMLAIAVG